MTCRGCSSSVERVLLSTPGLMAVSASHDSGEVRLTISGPYDSDEVAHRITDAGFDVLSRE
jgi:copper chaperone CopZ